MRFGLLYEAQRPFEGTTVDWNTLYKETLEQCVLAEKMGFDNIWFVEHHFLTGFSGSPCPEVLLGALSQLTRRIRIGFGVCILPYHHPVRVAERAAMLDQLTDTLCERGIILAGDPESCIKGVQLYEEAGVDQVILITQTETIPHERALQSIEMFGKHVIPACRTERRAQPAPAAAR